VLHHPRVCAIRAGTADPEVAAGRSNLQLPGGEQSRTSGDSLSSAVALNVELDTILTFWAAAAYDHLRQRLPGYEQMTPDTIWRRFISTSGQITIEPHQVTCRLASRTYSPIMRSAELSAIEIPWWNSCNRRLQSG
jgi:hypothetical protein